MNLTLFKVSRCFVHRLICCCNDYTTLCNKYATRTSPMAKMDLVIRCIQSFPSSKTRGGVVGSLHALILEKLDLLAKLSNLQEGNLILVWSRASRQKMSLNWGAKWSYAASSCSSLPWSRPVPLWNIDVACSGYAFFIFSRSIMSLMKHFFWTALLQLQCLYTHSRGCSPKNAYLEHTNSFKLGGVGYTLFQMSIVLHTQITNKWKQDRNFAPHLQGTPLAKEIFGHLHSIARYF